MSVTRPVGSDNPFAEWSPLPARPPLAWPGDAGVAVCVVISIEHLEWEPPPGAVPAPSVLGYGPYPRAFQLTGVSRLEYGSRVGVFRLLDLLDRYSIPAGVAMDAALMPDRRRLIEDLKQRHLEFLGHGVALSRTLSEVLTEDVERDDIQQSLWLIEEATGKRPRGWLGGEYAETTRTIRLLAELGVEYVCDWANDEQPYSFLGAGQRLTALPVTLDLDDMMVQKVRRLPPARWAQMVNEAVVRLAADGARGSGRVLLLNLHAHVSGQPFRIRYVDDVFAALTRMKGAWLASPEEVVDWYLQATTQPTAP